MRERARGRDAPLLVWLAVASALVLLAGAGCSSTTRRDVAVGVGADDGAGAAAGRASPATPGAGAVAGTEDRGPGAGGEVPSDGGGAPSADGQGSATASRRSPGSGPAAPGGTPGTAAGVAPAGAGGGTVTVGFEVVRDQSAAYAAIGAEGLGPRQERQYVDALTEWVNANGGIAGRELRAVVREVDVTVGTFAAQAQATCATFTEDNDVDFAVGRINDRDDLFACLSRKGVAMIAQNRYMWQRAAFGSNPALLYLPHSFAAERWGTWIDGLASAGYFDGGTHAVVRFDTPAYERAFREAVLPALARHGVDRVEEVVVHQPESAAHFGGMSSELGNAVLRMRTAGVDHVSILDEGTIAFFLLPHAESQRYRPVYGFHSQNIPQVLSVQRSIPPEQLRASVGAGWVPTLDVGFAQDPGPTPGFTACEQIYRDAGITFSDRFALNTGMKYCDSVLFLRAALERAPEISPAGLQAGVEALGATFPSALTFAASFGPGKLDGADAVRPFAYDFDGCRCFEYTR